MMIGTRHECQCCGRIVRITGTYISNEPGDNGYEYVYEDNLDAGIKRWVSTHAASVRFKKLEERQ